MSLVRVSGVSVWAALRTATDALASVVFPAPCRICQATLDTASRVPVCASCLASFEKLSPPWCACCGRPIISPVVADSLHILCRLCRANTYGFDVARSFALYNTPMVRAILLLKHEAVAPLGVWFANRVAERIAREPDLAKADVVVPVPLHPARLKERGYNQAELIARPLARRLHLRFKAFLLVRTKPRPDKLRLSRRERWTTVRGAYEAREGVRVDKLHVLLVDDVMATGATLDACSRALRKAGAARVTAVTVARSVPNWSAVDGTREQMGVPPF
jgi:competence protein ComFC